MTMSSEVPNLEAVYAALKSVKLLRSTVGDVFTHLADCPAISGGGQTQSEETRENTFIGDLQNALINVNTRFRELETACTLLAPPSATNNINLGNSSLLGQDPSYERTPLYTEMVNSYRWYDKLHEYSSHSSAILTQNSLKRSNINSLMLMSKIRPRRLLSNGHNIPLNQVDIFASGLQRLFPDMTIEVVRPFGSPAILKITVMRTLKAVILLRGLLIEWVMIKGFNESFDDDNYPYYDKRMRRSFDDERLDIWTESRYEIFRKITEHANAAMLHFYSPIHPDLAVKSFLTWLNSYSNLFSSPCRKCNCRLMNCMPPSWRDFRKLEAFHEQCKP